MPGQLVLMKNHDTCVFAPALVGPSEFIRYKNEGRVCWLKDTDGREFDYSVEHLVPVVDDLNVEIELDN